MNVRPHCMIYKQRMRLSLYTADTRMASRMCVVQLRARSKTSDGAKGGAGCKIGSPLCAYVGSEAEQEMGNRVRNHVRMGRQHWLNRMECRQGAHGMQREVV